MAVIEIKIKWWKDDICVCVFVFVCVWIFLWEGREEK